MNCNVKLYPDILCFNVPVYSDSPIPLIAKLLSKIHSPTHLMDSTHASRGIWTRLGIINNSETFDDRIESICINHDCSQLLYTVNPTLFNALLWNKNLNVLVQHKSTNLYLFFDIQNPFLPTLHTSLNFSTVCHLKPLTSITSVSPVPWRLLGQLPVFRLSPKTPTLFSVPTFSHFSRGLWCTT